MMEATLTFQLDRIVRRRGWGATMAMGVATMIHRTTPKVVTPPHPRLGPTIHCRNRKGVRPLALQHRAAPMPRNRPRDADAYPPSEGGASPPGVYVCARMTDGVTGWGKKKFLGPRRRTPTPTPTHTAAPTPVRRRRDTPTGCVQGWWMGLPVGKIFFSMGIDAVPTPPIRRRRHLGAGTDPPSERHPPPPPGCVCKVGGWGFGWEKNFFHGPRRRTLPLPYGGADGVGADAVSPSERHLPTPIGVCVHG